MNVSELRAWMIIPTYHPVIGGAQTQVDRLSRGLLQEKWNVGVLSRRHCYAHPSGLSKQDCFQGVPIHRVYSRGGTKLGSLLYLFLGLWHLLRHGRRSVFYAHDIGTAGWIAVIARRICGGRAVIKMRTGRMPYLKLLSSPLKRWSFLPLLKLADRIVVVNSEVERLMLDLGVPAERVLRIPNGVDLTACQIPTPEQRDEARKDLGLPSGTTVALYVGRLEALKRVDLAVRAWARLPEPILSRSRLLIVGDGPEREALDALVERLGLRDSVSLLGERRDVRTFYQAADVFLLTSETEGLSNALMEAMASGLVVVASNVGGAVDVIEESVSGFLFESGNDADLASKLMRVLEQPCMRLSIGEQARERAAAYADLRRVLSRVSQTCLTLTLEVGRSVSNWVP